VAAYSPIRHQHPVVFRAKGFGMGKGWKFVQVNFFLFFWLLDLEIMIATGGGGVVEEVTVAVVDLVAEIAQTA